MVEAKIIEQKPISMAQLKEEIKEIKKRDEELGFRTAKIAEYLETVKVLKEKEVEEIFTKVEKLSVPRLKEMHIYKIIDLMPANMTELKNIIQGYGLTITNDNLEKILEIMSDYLPKKKQ
jgi:DNA-directed RNA polymerase subunit F